MVGTAYVALALAAGAAWAGTNLLDDRVIDRWDGRALPIAGAAGLVRGVALPGLALAGLLPVPSLRAVVAGALVGVVSFAGLLAYYRAIDAGDVVQYAVVSETGPLAVLVTAVLVLGERPTPVETAGIVALVAGALLVTAERRGVRVAVKPEAGLVVLATLLSAAISVLAEVVVAGFATGLALVGWLWAGAFASAGVAVALGVVSRDGVADALRTPGVRRPLLAGVGTESLGYAAYFTALSLGPVAVASGLSSVRPFVALVGVVLVRRSLPDADALDRRTVAVYAVAAGLVVAGVLLVESPSPVQ